MEQRGDTRASSPGPRRTLKVLGSLHLSVPDTNGDTKLGRKEFALLAYLALHAGRPQSRAKLAGLLWGNILEDSARQDLRQALSKLRQALNDQDHQLIKSIKLGGEEAVLLDAAVVEVDATVFEDLARRQDRASLEAAANLYAGDLLEGLDVRIDGFENWLSSERARLRHLAVDTLVEISRRRADANETQAAIESLLSALRLDPLREDACRQIMLVYALTGRRSAALQEYSNLQAVLQRELQTEPEPETSALAESIRHAAPAPSRGVEAPLTPVPNANAKPQSATAMVATDAGAGRRPAGLRRIMLFGIVVLTGALVVALTAIAVAYWRIPELAPAPLGEIILYIKEGYLGRQIIPERPSIAVLPFAGRGDAGAQEYAEAISEGTASTLSIVSEMRVVPQLSVLAAMGDRSNSSSVSPGTIARQLNVRYLLEGSVLKSNNNVSVTIVLIDTAQGDSRALTETVSSHGTDIIVLQRDITLEIVTALQTNLTEGEQERINRAHSTRNVDAWIAASRGEKLLRRLTEEANLAARSFYEDATKLDPGYAGAWDGLAWTFLLEARFGWTGDPSASLRKADEFAQKTLMLDANRPRTYSLLGSLHLMYGDHAQAIAYGERAVRLEANDADAAALLAYTYTYAGQPERATTLVERAMELRPYSPEWYLWLKGRAQRQAGRYDDAIRTLRPAADANSPTLFALVELAAAYSAAGQFREARAIASRVLEISPEFSSSGWSSLVQFRDPEDAEDEIVLLKQAGLPN